MKLRTDFIKSKRAGHASPGLQNHIKPSSLLLYTELEWNSFIGSKWISLFLFLFLCCFIPVHVSIFLCFYSTFFYLYIKFNCILFKEISDSLPLKSSLDISDIIIGVFYRSSHKRCSVKKVFLENSQKFTGKHLCQNLFFNKVAGLRPLLTEHLWWLLLILNIFAIIFLGNFVCDIMRAAAQTDIALLNSGSLRSDTIHPSGPFKMKVMDNLL